MTTLEEYEWNDGLGVLVYETEGEITPVEKVVEQPLAKHVPSDYDSLRDKYWSELKQWLAMQ